MTFPTGQVRVALEAVADYARLCEQSAQSWEDAGRIGVAHVLRAQAAGARCAARHACGDVASKEASS